MISFEFTGSLQELRKLLDPDYLRQAEISALKATQQQTATRVSRKAREKYNVTAGAIARRLKMGLASGGKEAYLQWVGTRIGLINFSAQFRRVQTSRGSRHGATAKILKTGGRFLTKGGFIARGRNGNVHIYQRQNLGQKGRFPLIAKYGPSIPQMIEDPEVFADAERFVAQAYPDILANRLQYFFEKQMTR